MDDAEHEVPGTVVERLLSILGFVEFAAGDHEATDRVLTRMRQLHASTGLTEPMFDRSEPFHIESLVALGEHEQAQGDPDAARGAGPEVPAPVDRRHAAAGKGARACGT